MAKSKRKKKSEVPKHVSIKFNNTVLQFIRQHARSSPDMEICGVLIGQKDDKQTIVEGAISGKGASQGGTHVTFTQETWNDIHHEKEKKYPEQLIVGWYHSHPGFGVFLSEHDLFIHNNFFPDPGHIAWVFDPKSDEEGCFGWVDGKVSRILQFEITTDFDDNEQNKKLQFDFNTPKKKLLKTLVHKKWLIPLLFGLNCLFFIIIVFLFFALKTQNTKIFKNNAIKNESETIRMNKTLPSQKGENILQVEKTDTLENMDLK